MPQLNCCATECIDAAMPKLAAATEGTGIALGAYGNIFEGTTSQWLETATHGPRPYPWYAFRCNTRVFEFLEAEFTKTR